MQAFREGRFRRKAWSRAETPEFDAARQILLNSRIYSHLSHPRRFFKCKDIPVVN